MSHQRPNQSLEPNGTPLRGKDEGKIMKDEVKTELGSACRG